MKKIYAASVVVPVTSAPIHNGAIAVDEDGIITYVGSADGAPKGEVHDFGNAWLMPGLINAHTHLELTGLHGKMSGLSFTEWIDQMRELRMNGTLTDDSLLQFSRDGIAEGLRFGATTYSDTAYSGSIVLEAMLEAGVRGIVYQEVFGPLPEQRDAAITDLKQKVKSLQQRLSNSQGDSTLVKIGVSPHAPYTVSDDLYKATVQFARKEHIPVAMHIAESDAEQDFVSAGSGPFAERLQARGLSVQSRGRSPIAMLDKLGALGANTLLIHCVRVDDNDVATIKRGHCSVAHCPTSNFFLANGISPVTKFLDAGIPVGLGTDSMASNNSMSIIKEAELASVMQEGFTGNPAAITPQAALEMLTIKGAEALGLAGRIGSLEVGKDADIAAFPMPDQAPEAIFLLSSTPADFVAVKGKQVYPQ